MTPERRHTDNPHPPGDTPERRHCSDDECRAARDLWYTEVLLPKLMIRFYIGVASSVLALAGVFMFLSRNEIRDFDLKAKEYYESQNHHDADINRVEKKIDNLVIQFGTSTQSVLDRLDRNWAEIRQERRPPR